MLFLCIEQYQIKINILNITSICQPTVSKSSPEVKIKNKVYLYIIKSTKAKQIINSHWRWPSFDTFFKIFFWRKSIRIQQKTSSCHLSPYIALYYVVVIIIYMFYSVTFFIEMGGARSSRWTPDFDFFLYLFC